MGIIRAEVVARAKKYIKEGVSASRWISEMREMGLGYRRTDMLVDYRNVFNIEQKKDLLKYVRRGYAPAERTSEIKGWAMSQEYMYKIRCQQIFAGVPADEPTFVNLMHDTPQTIEALEQEAWERSFKQSPPKSGEERQFAVISAFHRVEM